jgi:hypothetical protein
LDIHHEESLYDINQIFRVLADCGARNTGSHAVNVKFTHFSPSALSACWLQLETLLGDAATEVDFRVLPESASCQKGALTKYNHRGRITDSALMQRLMKANRAGFAVYFCTAESNGKGVKKEHMLAARCAVLDLDNAPLPSKWEVVPHVIIETSPGRYQCFFALEPTTDFAAVEDINRRLAARYGGDPNVCDVTHLFRLAGFKHQKGEPFEVLIKELNEFEPKRQLSDFDFLPKLPERSAATTTPSVGALDPDTAELLFGGDGALDPMAFDTNEKWIELTMATHAAYRGDSGARDVYLEFSKRDPKYDDDRPGSRWDSLSLEKEKLLGVGTLIKICRDHDVPDDIMRAVFVGNPADDFEGFEDPDFDLGVKSGVAVDDGVPSESEYTAESDSALEALNEKYTAVFANGSYRIMYREGEAESANGKPWVAASKADFINRHENRSIERGEQGRGKSRVISLGTGWQTWAGRKTADGTVLDPRCAPGAITNGKLNLWSGFAIKAEPGNWELFRTMILEDLCNGDQAVFDYVVNWSAWKLQNPGLLPEVAIAFLGPKGAGKTTYGETMAKIFGCHGMVAEDIDQIAGRFNGHLETKCFVYADEAVWGGDKRSESALKKLITDKEGTYEYKGVDIFSGPNHVGLALGGNDKWIVPASMDERRFCASKVSGAHFAPPGERNHPNRLYWNRLHTELNNGGRAAFLHDMLERDLAGWHPREDVPTTEAMGEQKLHGLKEVGRWWFEILRDGEPLSFLSDF